VHTSVIDSFLGRRIREVRERQGLLLVDVARTLAVAPTELADYESGRLRISASGLFMLTRALGVSVHEIYDGLATAVANDETSIVVTTQIIDH
jgi:transcriptional regulator with XRE-family HTH domain